MSAHIIIGSRAVGLSAGAALRHTRDGRPSKRPEGRAHSRTPERGACGLRENVRYESARVAGRRIGHDRETVMFLPNNPARIEFAGSLRASRARISGHARFQFLQEPMRCVRQAFHVNLSFPIASASQMHLETKERHVGVRARQELGYE